MHVIKLFLWLGIWLIILPFLGIPGVWKERLLILTGVVVIAVVGRLYYSMKVYSDSKSKDDTEKKSVV
ncbi:MAG: hypothetical protein COV91_05400 [Candidatus Taylorbacteria bacterium CG11_big_fil_rev_8_21_14_0_20_46_11]|uniref:Uncharacterized protein n=1 Tax=Candidatus Taylorbacteria bacterium CG11_big_fil_rev_8_21_14_0_20_46_11 TaxID=1975025 RepID=A0A2H0KAE0_9BACT|nr:MAG: hypothetical protein COV91_05400 [Candidatus Taylorbacteria bacterium CG11_big_fil_rev_8_21_14_0_20_46_11]